MATIPTQNPGSSEIQSPLMAGFADAISKISSILSLKTEIIEDYPMNSVYIDNTEKNKNRIYESTGHRLWLSIPQPVIKKIGDIITSGFSIDYLGGSITFVDENNPTDQDVITVSVTDITAESNTINEILNSLNIISQSANRYLGAFDTIETLNTSYPSSTNGNYAIVLSIPSVFIWKDNEWVNSQSIEDLSNYYTKQETDSLLGNKQDTINPKGETASDDNYYYGGRKTWQDVNKKVRNSPLTGMDSSVNSNVEETDTVLEAAGKFQGQLNDIKNRTIIRQNSIPTSATSGQIGQRYVDTSTGQWYVLTDITTKDGVSSYTWTSYVPTEDMDNYIHAPIKSETFNFKTKFTDVICIGFEGESIIIGTPSINNPAQITGLPFQATISGENMESKTISLGFVGYSLPDGVNDNYDGVSGRLIKRINKLVVDGTENWVWVNSLGNSGKKAISLNVEKVSTRYNSTLLCTHYQNSDAVNSYYNICYISGVGTSIVIVLQPGISNLEEAKSYLANQNAAGTPVTFFYEMKYPDILLKKSDISGLIGNVVVNGASSALLIDDRIYRFNGISVNEIFPPGALLHNSRPRMKFLGNQVTPEQYKSISDGTFEDLYVGDYWIINDVLWRIYDFDYYLNCGDSNNISTMHHVVIVPDKSLYNAKMNDTNTTVGGYYNSTMYNTNLNQAKTIINTAFNGHILNHRICVTNAVSNGQGSATIWVNSTVDLMCSQMVFGSGIFSPVASGSIIPANNVVEKSQLSLFRHSQNFINPYRENWWLRDIISTTQYIRIRGTGEAYYDGAIQTYGVRPSFVIF